MKNKYYLSILLLGFLSSCMTGQKSLEKGNYDLAVYRAVKKLQNKPGHKKSTIVLQDAYNMAVENHFNSIEYFDQSTSGNKWSRIADEYKSINNLNNNIMRYPYYKSILTLVDVKAEMNSAKQEASKVHYSKGLVLLESGIRADARQAYQEFISAAHYVPNNAAIEQKMNEALEAGTVNIALEFPRDEINFYAIRTSDLYYSILNESSALPYKFLRVVDVNDERYPADEIIQLKMDHLFIGNVNFQEYRERVVREDIVIGEARIDDSTVVDVYGKVAAEFQTFTKTVNSTGSLLIQRINPSSGSIINQTRIPASYNWVGTWGNFRGDERALDANQLNIARSNEPYPPSSEWLFAQLHRPFFAESVRIIRDTYAYLR